MKFAKRASPPPAESKPQVLSPDDVQALCARFWGGGGGRRPDVFEVEAALRALPREALTALEIPYSTGDTGSRCDWLRGAVARALEEK